MSSRAWSLYDPKRRAYLVGGKRWASKDSAEDARITFGSSLKWTGRDWVRVMNKPQFIRAIPVLTEIRRVK